MANRDKQLATAYMSNLARLGATVRLIEIEAEVAALSDLLGEAAPKKKRRKRRKAREVETTEKQRLRMHSDEDRHKQSLRMKAVWRKKRKRARAEPPVIDEPPMRIPRRGRRRTSEQDQPIARLLMKGSEDEEVFTLPPHEAEKGA